MSKKIVYDKFEYLTTCEDYSRISFQELKDKVEEAKEYDDDNTYKEYFIGFEGPREYNYSETYSCVLMGSRLETDEEYENRLKKEQEEKEKRSEYDRRLYEDLKKRFEK